MSYLINNTQKINDIIFENRNKMYGAYAIRSAYGNTIFKSIACMMIGFGTILSIAFYMSNKPEEQEKTTPYINEHDSIFTLKVNMEPPKAEPVLPPEQAKGGAPGGMSTVISSTAAVDSNTTTAVSSGPTTGTLTEGVGSSPSGTTAVVSTSADVGSSEPVAIPDAAPEFEGGLRGLYAFLTSRLNYPNEARDIGKEGTVYVKFVVDQNGKVGSLSLLNNLGYGLDQEAMRVVGMIPNFKTPGKVNGKAVKVYYQLPIKFKIR